MPTDRRIAAATAFWTDENAALEQAEAIALIARQIKFRPRSVQALGVDKRAKYLAASRRSPTCWRRDCWSSTTSSSSVR